MKVKTLDELIEGLKKKGVRIERINPTHVADLYKRGEYLGRIVSRKGAHIVKWDEKAGVLEHEEILRYIIKSGYDVDFSYLL
ncbi:MAG: hypothetical protein K6T16_01375 [Candidatus Pacearchaeota archaeon]|nr:hypothetical protein [Candidatus Pacearchaeota archaeon]